MADWSVIPTVIVSQYNETSTLPFLVDHINWSDNIQSTNTPINSPGVSILRATQNVFLVDHFNWSSNIQSTTTPVVSPISYVGNTTTNSTGVQYWG